MACGWVMLRGARSKTIELEQNFTTKILQSTVFRNDARVEHRLITHTEFNTQLQNDIEAE